MRIIVSHRESNVSSKFANQKHGFRWTYDNERIWNDGLREKERFYELILDEAVADAVVKKTTPDP